MKELFVEQPSIDVMVGVRVKKESEFTYKNDKVEQVLKDLVLETILEDEGTNGINSYKSKSYLQLQLNPGDVLLFDEKRGYYMPPYPVSSIEEAISDMESLREIKYEIEEG